MITLVMTGQILSSLALDNFGLLGLETQPLSLKRIVAAALLIGGAALMTQARLTSLSSFHHPLCWDAG
jgi:uncharacterized membrane protein YdcZ (DUF606 family)